VIVVATEDFEVYHDVVNELRSRGAEFTTIEPEADVPADVRVVITGVDEVLDTDAPVVVAEPDEPRRAVEEAFALLRGSTGRTTVGIDPGERPGIAVLRGETVVSVFHVPIEDAAEVVCRELADAVDPVVRVGDGARLQGTRIIDDLDGFRVELVDETGTTPSLGTGARGMGDVLAAVNIARLDGEVVENRTITPTAGEIQLIKNRSRERSTENRTINEELARRVAVGELTLDEAIDEHAEE